MKNIRDYTVEELLKDGARVEVSYHDVKNVEEASLKIDSFSGLNDPEYKNHDGTYWVKAVEDEDGIISVLAFYKK